MQFPARDLTNQYISKSYQDVLQQYPQGDVFYVLDGLGNVVFVIPSASLGNVIITSNITSSMTVATASYATTYSFIEYSDVALSASWASHSLSASWAPGMSGGTSDSSSWASSSISASYAETATIAGAAYYADIADTASIALSASIAETASYANNASQSLISVTAVTASYAESAVSASYFSGSISNAVYADTASWAITASHALTAESLTNSGLSIPKYDYSYVEYTGPMTQVSTCSYRVGGVSGSLVARVVALYSGNTFTGVTSSIF